MRILVTGGSSFVGAHFCLSAARRHEVFALHHRTPLQLNGVTPLRCDLRRDREVPTMKALAPDVIVHLASKIRAETVGKGKDPVDVVRGLNRRMMDVVLELGCPVLYASSTVVGWDQSSPYAEARREDEQRLRDSGRPYAVVRPCAPYGPALAVHQPRHRESFHTLVDIVRASPIVPVVGDGQYRRQPIHTADLSDAMLALIEGGLAGQELDAGGAEALPFDGIIDAIGHALGRSPRKLHLPKALFVKLAQYTRDFEPTQMATLDSDDVADPGPLTAATGVRPRAFSEGVRDLV